ncbi:hypothetical protein [Caldibacillus debilis]|nr:hypothetical protein [Caldibacillus debilis]
MMAKIPHITVHHGQFRENRTVPPAQAEEAVQTSKEHHTIDQKRMPSPPPQQEPDPETRYALEVEKLLDEYTHFSQSYKDVARLIKNPIRFRRQAGVIFQQLIRVGKAFNARIQTFREEAIPPEDMKQMHENLLESLREFETYNREFPKLAARGNLPRIIELSKGLERGQKGLQSFFEALEEREKRKERK